MPRGKFPVAPLLFWPSLSLLLRFVYSYLLSVRVVELNRPLCLTDWPLRPIVSTLVFSSAGSLARARATVLAFAVASVERLPSSPLVRLRWRWQRRRSRDPFLRPAALGWGKIIAHALGGGDDSPLPLRSPPKSETQKLPSARMAVGWDSNCRRQGR